MILLTKIFVLADEFYRLAIKVISLTGWLDCMFLELKPKYVIILNFGSQHIFHLTLFTFTYFNYPVMYYIRTLLERIHSSSRAMTELTSTLNVHN